MKSRWVRGLFIFSLFFSLALKQNDVVELEQYFNARYSANFLKTTQNVKFVIPPGTQGKIEEVKKFDSGNFGLQVTLQNGKNKGEKVWVYYRPSSPGMKLYEGEAAKSAATSVVEEAKSAVTTERTDAWRTPAGEPIPLVVTKEYAEELMKKLDTVQEKIKVVETKNQNPCDDDCKLAQQTYGRDLPKAEEKPEKPVEKPKVVVKPELKREPVQAAGVRDEKSVRLPKPKAPPKVLVEDDELAASHAASSTVATHQPPPPQDPPTLRNFPNTENRNRSAVYKCYTPTMDVGHCSQPGYGVTSIQITNYTSRKSAPGELMKNRKWNALAPAAARQDAGLWVTDDLGGSNSSLKESMIMIFPRVTMPSVRSQGNNNIVTLPSGETITFEKNTGRVVGGVFSEQPMAPGQLPRVTYKGNKLMIRANSSGKDPRIGGTATVTKQGKSCTVPKKNLWGQGEHDGQGFKYFSDKDLDAYLKSKCGFGIY